MKELTKNLQEEWEGWVGKGRREEDDGRVGERFFKKIEKEDRVEEGSLKKSERKEGRVS